MARYEQETDISIKRALLLCLGGFDVTQLPPGERKRLAKMYWEACSYRPSKNIPTIAWGFAHSTRAGGLRPVRTYMPKASADSR